VVYTSAKIETLSRKQLEIPVLLDPSVLRAARTIYRSYCAHRPNMTDRVKGVAINPATFRGQLVCNNKPILLPGERFVPIDLLESELY
jgi:hypothetical protein